MYKSPIIKWDSFFIVMVNEQRVIVQGVPGCFHEEAAHKYFRDLPLEIIPARTFVDLASILVNNADDHLAIIAIENSIAGSLLQNYRIIRENHLRIIGEVYLRIKHNLMALPGQAINDIKEVHSHPMAINQCLDFLREYPHIRIVEKEDTALSAKNILQNNLLGVAAIASETAADIYNMEILANSIETSHMNYTRFFIAQDSTQPLALSDFDKASIYLRVPHQKGSLVKVLQTVSKHNIDLSKLQSYPVLGEVNTYYFHLDLEFDDLDDYENCIDELQDVTTMIEVIGLYKRDYATAIIHQQLEDLGL